MAELSPTKQELFFGEGFLEDHAGSIIREPRVAVIELIANAYDAGATEVKIEWPHEIGGSFSITDNGAGMTNDEFDRIASARRQLTWAPEPRPTRRA